MWTWKPIYPFPLIRDDTRQISLLLENYIETNKSISYQINCIQYRSFIGNWWKCFVESETWNKLPYYCNNNLIYLQVPRLSIEATILLTKERGIEFLLCNYHRWICIIFTTTTTMNNNDEQHQSEIVQFLWHITVFIFCCIIQSINRYWITSFLCVCERCRIQWQGRSTTYTIWNMLHNINNICCFFDKSNVIHTFGTHCCFMKRNHSFLLDLLDFDLKRSM